MEVDDLKGRMGTATRSKNQFMGNPGPGQYETSYCTVGIV